MPTSRARSRSCSIAKTAWASATRSRSSSACRRRTTICRTPPTRTGSCEFAKYDLFLSQQIAHFLGRLNEYKDRNGSVLDNTIVLFGSGASTTHNSRNLPTLIAGGANMGLKHGTYWRNGETRMSNMYLSILRSLGIEQESFADSTGTVDSTDLHPLLSKQGPPRMRVKFKWLGSSCALAIAFYAVASAQDEALQNNAQAILAESCYACHGPGQQMGNLRLDTARPR